MLASGSSHHFSRLKTCDPKIAMFANAELLHSDTTGVSQTRPNQSSSKIGAVSSCAVLLRTKINSDGGRSRVNSCY